MRDRHPSADLEIYGDREPGAIACLARTRSTVLNVLVGVGAGIAASGWLIGRHVAQGPIPWGIVATQQRAMMALVGLIAVAYLILRVGSGRDALRDPATRARRFFRARVATAAVGSLAVPLGFVYGWFADGHLAAVAPFWVAALGLGFLALPRGYELDDFAEPIEEATSP